jgi:undecaprenyl-diphosphatase
MIRCGLALILNLFSFYSLAQNVDSSALASSDLASASSGQTESVISPFQAAILGLVEGITEYLPVSSTGHLVLTSEFLGIRSQGQDSQSLEAVEAFEIVIQSGAILAVVLLYFEKMKLLILGLMGRSREGKKLLQNIIVAFIPTVVLGLLFNQIIKDYLQHPAPVVFALALGGVVMIVFEKSKRANVSRASGSGLETLTLKTAFFIGMCQTIAMWPGTSRSMVTILGGMFLGLSPVASAEFSFLLGLPTLLAATLFKAYKDGPVLIEHVSPLAMMVGLSLAAVSALIAVKGFVAWLNRHGLTYFGYYRVVVATIFYFVLMRT